MSSYLDELLQYTTIKKHTTIKKNTDMLYWQIKLLTVHLNLNTFI